MGDVRCPASQPVHSDEAAGATWPGAQATQIVPFTAYVPDSQTVHRSWRGEAIEPASHDAHDEDAAGAGGAEYTEDDFDKEMLDMEAMLATS